ncbi:MAG: GlsB/YeaQ/YmgE family stress response membrane protein [Rhizobiales bacterium]|nr:GlsB/YeaQ/YmgE family stress response membrane protein [Hyphomicrobiales bacterium]
MEGYGIFMQILLGGLAGWIAEKVMRFDTGLIMNIILGIVGAIVGNKLLALLGFGLGGVVGQLIVAVLGACILILIYRAVRGRA